MADFHIEIGGDPQPDSGFAIIIGTTEAADEGALAEVELPCCLPPGTILIALVWHSDPVVQPAGWLKFIDNVGDDGIFLDGFALEVGDDYEGGSLEILSLTTQQLRGTLTTHNNLTMAQLLGAQVEHAPFSATLTPAAPIIESQKLVNSLIAAWAADSEISLEPPSDMETVETFTTAEVSPQSLLVAHRRTFDALVVNPGNATASSPAAGRSFAIVLNYNAELNALEESLFRFGKDALPPWMPSRDTGLMAAAKHFARVHGTLHCLFHQARIGTACGPTPTTPDFLGQHARDRGTGRMPGESNTALRARLKNQPDALTRDAILDAVAAVLAAEGVTGEAAMLELPRDAAFTGEFTAMSGTGGTFAQDGSTQEFTPSALPWPVPPFRSPDVFPELQHQLTISGAAEADNDGTRAITALDGNAAVVTNADGVADFDPAADWTVERRDGSGNVTDGFARAYTGRGYRCCRTLPMTLVLILPFGTTEGIASSIREMLRTKKAAGFRVIVERRLIP